MSVVTEVKGVTGGEHPGFGMSEWFSFMLVLFSSIVELIEAKLELTNSSQTQKQLLPLSRIAFVQKFTVHIHTDHS